MAKKRRSTDSVLGIDAQWRAESDLSTYMEWKKIKQDPKRLKAVKELAKKKLEDMAAAASISNDNDGDE